MENFNLENLKQKIEYNRLLGEFIGTMEGLLHYDIPNEIKVKLKDKIKRLKKIPL